MHFFLLNFWNELFLWEQRMQLQGWVNIKQRKKTDLGQFGTLTWFKLVLSYSSWTALSWRILCRKAGGWWMSMGAAVGLAGSRTASSKYSSLMGHVIKKHGYVQWRHLVLVYKENISNRNRLFCSRRKTRVDMRELMSQMSCSSWFPFCLHCFNTSIYCDTVSSSWKFSDSNNSGWKKCWLSRQ